MRYVVLLAFFIYTVTIQAQQQLIPPIEWQKSLGGSKIERAYSMLETSDHGYLVVGLSFSNDGQVTGHHGSTDSSDAWVVKLDQSGNILWQQSYGGTGTDQLIHAVQTSNGDFICVGTTRSTDGDITGLHMNGAVVADDVWALRISSTGNIVWSKVFGGSARDRGRVVRQAWDGGFIIGGDVASTDGDVTGAKGFVDMWVLKINEAGVLQWQKTMGTANDDVISSLNHTSDGNYIIGGYHQYRGVPPQGVYPIYSEGQEASLKFDQAGNVIWQNFPVFPIGVPGRSYFIQSLVELPNGNLFQACHTYSASLPNSSGWDNKVMNSADGTRFYINGYNPSSPAPLEGDYYFLGPESVKVLSDSSVLMSMSIDVRFPTVRHLGTISRISTKASLLGGRFRYNATYGGIDGTTYFSSLLVLADETLLAAGASNATNGDVSGNHGNYDFWVVRFKPVNRITGRLFLDGNNNGIREAGEKLLSNVLVQTSKGDRRTSSFSGTDGSFEHFVDTGTYTTVATPNLLYHTANPAAKQSSFTTYKNTDSFDIAITPIPNKKDLQIGLQGSGMVRPGFDVNYTFAYKNKGTETINNVIVKVTKSSFFQLISATPVQSSAVADTIGWNIGTLTPGTNGSITVTFKASASLVFNDVIDLLAVIEPVAGDETPADNKGSVRHLVRGSYDPNDKQEVHGKELFKHEYDAGDYLTYTIRFQNTGNDTAFNIVIRDTLHAKLDENSIEMIATSHPCKTVINNGQNISWTFNDILLPDSNVNEPLSHGYITYRIKPKAGLAINDVIPNSASIYFDFNLPVKTNTVETVMKVLPLPNQPGVGGIQATYCSHTGVHKGKIENLPATGSGVTVAVTIDGNPFTVAADSTFSFNVGAIGQGTHALVVTFTNVAGNKAATQSFVVTGSATPDVDVSANITNVINLATPVVVTAANTAGGGTAPLYTFAKDRSFSTILQAEGSSATLNVDPNNLTIGNNWIYVRMKTSATCYTAQTNIDSINVRRDQMTGIVDIDNPAQIINIYPNPFKSQITIGGLSAQKKYLVTITNLQGQQVYNRKVNNRTTIELPTIHGATGVYWLTLYDATKQRSLGSVKLIKE